MAFYRTAIAIVSLFIGSATLFAQTSDLSRASLEELMNIQVYSASKYLQGSETAPSLVTVVTADEIQKYGYRTLADILRSVGGFYVTYDRNYSYVGVRGFNRPGDYNTRILLLLDGHRLNDAIYDMAYVGTDFILDLDLIERVEVIRGPSSSLYGTNAFFAVINVITKRGAQLNGAELSSEAGSFNTYKGRASYGKQFHPFELLLSGTYYTSAGQNLFFPEFNTPENNFGVAAHGDDDRSRTLFGELGIGKLALRAAYVEREKGIPTAAFGDIFNNPISRSVDTLRSFDAQYQTTVHRDWEVSLRGFHDLYKYDGKYAYQDLTQPNPILNVDSSRGEWWGGEARLSHYLFEKHRVTAGMELRQNLRQDQSNYDVQPSWLYLDDHRSSWLAALYVQDEFSVSPKFLLNLGIRHDQYSTFGGSTNPRLGLIYRPRGKTTLKFLYGTAFRAPNTFELYYNSNTQIANPALRPESISTSEIVLEHDLSRHFHLAASGYYNHINNLISQYTEPLEDRYVFRNMDAVGSKGLELELSAKWLSGLEGHASYNLQRTTDRTTGQVLTNSPLHLAKLGVIVPVVESKLFASLDSWYMSRRQTISGASVGGFGLINATLLSRNLGRHTELSVGLYNLFDKNYADPGAEEHVQDALRQDGRNFRVKVTFRF
jgi:outer membrane receptor for ferrienterochelin and colicin